MKSRYKKIMLSALTAMLCIAVLTAGFFYITPKRAAAMNVGVNSIQIKGKNGTTRLDKSDGTIDGDVLKDLYTKLTNNSNADLQDVKDALAPQGVPHQSSNTWYDGFSAEEIAALNDGSDLYLTFGGLKWTVVYLSLDRNDEPVVTLMLADYSDYNKTSSFVYSNFLSGTYGDFLADHGTYRLITDFDYPAARYSTSELRSALNVGMFKATSTEGGEQINQDSNDALAVFTMTDKQLVGTDKKSLMKYIDMPYLVPYQATETWVKQYDAGVGNTLSSPNAAYGKNLDEDDGVDSTYRECASNKRNFCIQAPSNFDYNSYALNNYMYDHAGISREVNNGFNTDVVNNMSADLSSINLYDGDWKRTVEWTESELETKSKWVDSESWAFDTVWIPSLEECGSERTYIKDSIWGCSANQRIFSKAYWLRNANGGNATFAYAINETGVWVDMGEMKSAGNVRPAMHLNLAAAENGVGITIPTPLEDTYTGEKIEKVIPDYEKLNCEVEAESKSKGAEYNADDGTFSATDAGTYTLECTPKTGLFWKDGSKDKKTYTFTIKPAKIEVKFDDSSDESKKQVRTYTYHEETEHEIELSKDIIKVIAPETNTNINISYLLRTHKENEYADKDAHDKAVFSNPPAIDDREWSPDIPKAKEPGGYCVWFKIEVDNHEIYYGTDGKGTGSYISVHIATEVLQIKVKQTDGKLGEFEYGKYGDADKDKLYEELLKDNYDIIYPDTSSEIKDRIDPTEIRFWLTDSKGGAGQTPVGSHWDVGTYYLNAQWVDTTGEHFVTFEWYKDDQTPRQPWIKIIPKKITALTWEGNAKWNDGAYQGGAANAGDLEDEFCWVYDRQGGAAVKYKPRAKFAGLDGDIYLTVEGEKDTAGSHTATAVCKTEDGTEIKNYVFDDGLTATQTFKIVKAKNSWTTPYSCKGWSVGGDTSNVETKAVPKFGLASAVEYVYHKETKEGEVIQYSELFNQPAMKVVVVYSLAADSAGNYGEIEGEYTFTISSCAHDKIRDESYHEGDSEHSTQHYRICPDCNEKVYNDCQAKPLLEYTATQHYSVCKFCERKYDYKDHNWKDPEVTPPTCTENGKKVTKCQDCEYQKEEAGDAATGHNYTDSWTWSADNIPTLTITCSNNCGASEVFTAGAGGVTVQSAINKAATCDENGETKYTAKYTFECHEYTDEHTAVINAKGHANKHKVEAKAATCAEEGNNEYWHCDDCNKNYRDETCVFEIGEDNIKLAKTAHSYATEWASDGTSHYHECSVCHDKKDVAAHTEVKTAAVAATCTEDGLTEGSSCSICNKVLVAPETVPATGHEHMDHHEYKEAQATSAGNLEYWYCDDCESYFLDDSGTLPTDKNSVIIPALGSTLNGGNLNPPLGGDTGLSGSGSGSGSDVGEFFKQNWWWIVLIAAIIILLIATIAIVSAVHRRRREREMDKRFEMMMRMQAGAYQPMGAYQYGQNGAAAGGVEGVEGGGRLALPSGISEETLAKAIAIALNEVNSAKTETADEGTRLDDVDGFYDDVEDPDNPTGNGDGGFDGGNGAGSGGNG